MPEPAIYDHYRLIGGDYPQGIYRVVGTTEEAVTVLRVGDADGRRVNTGEVYAVPIAEFTTFETAENPDGNRSPGGAFRSSLKSGYWGLRAFLGQLAANPGPAAVALVLVAAGLFGEGRLSAPPLLLDVSVLVGSLLLVYAGSGRLSAQA